MTSARLAAIQARRAAEFLDICADVQERAAHAKAALASARSSGDENAIAEARRAWRAVADEVHEFRRWARENGSPPEGRPGRDAVIKAGV